MPNAPYWPRPECRHMRFIRSSARRMATLGAGLLPRSLLSRSFGLVALLSSGARADGIPEPGQIGFQEAVTPIAHELEFFHNWILLPIITSVTLFVVGLLIYVMFRFNEKANPAPARTTHNSGLEVAWTVAPVMILVVIAIPSFPASHPSIGCAAGGHNDEGDRQAMVLDLYLSQGSRRRFRIRFRDDPGRRPEAWRYPPAFSR